MDIMRSGYPERRSIPLKEYNKQEKALFEMTLEELWRLFPIYLTEHKKDWKTWYHEEEKNLSPIMPSSAKIHHIGSTAISNIWAKPIVDILVKADPKDLAQIKENLINNGYVCMAENKRRIDFNKGYTSQGFAEKVFHLHLRNHGDNDELYFRDYLNKHRDVAKQYEDLKLSLWKPFEHNRDGYTESKTAFVEKYTQKAKKQYGQIY
jgi:GrpB-like predicted nucleotidyltransferase (UPF0157 family)